MKQIKLKELKFGDTFKRKLNAKYSYSKGRLRLGIWLKTQKCLYYKVCSSDSKGYECTHETDFCRCVYIKGDTDVYIDKPKKVIVRTIGTTQQNKIEVTGGFVNLV